MILGDFRVPPRFGFGVQSLGFRAPVYDLRMGSGLGFGFPRRA